MIYDGRTMTNGDVMKELKQYVKQTNDWRAIFGDEPLTLTSAADCRELAERIESDLSPENLTCDGEVSGAARYKMLVRAQQQLRDVHLVLINA